MTKTASWLLALGLAATAVLLLTQRGLGGEPPGGARAVPRDDLERKPAVQAVRATEDPFLGLLLPRERADVVSLLSGKVVEMHVRLGDRVRAGDVIATLDSRLAEADLAAAAAALDSQQVEEERAGVKFAASASRAERLKVLAAEGLAPGEELTEAQVETVQAQLAKRASRSLLQQRRAQLERLSVERRLMHVRAPFDGIVAARFADPGAAVGPGGPPLARIISSELMLRVAVPESRAMSLAHGDRLEAHAEHDGEVFHATVDRVAAEIDPISRLWIVEASLDDDGADARAEHAEQSAGDDDAPPASATEGRPATAGRVVHVVASDA